ncbi:MAG: Lrp/AsnC family transcriptional regulator [Peptococcaceae bacterium]|nr:Lrp/AsnC family transcriptional regulator [Peptococcaceae bacterium]
MDLIDRELLNRVQEGIPVTEQPYAELAAGLGICEDDVMARLRSLMEAGVIRRMGGVFDSRRLGYKGTLCAMQVPQDRIEDVAAVVNRYPGITHNYLRRHAYNMWFTVLSRSQEMTEGILAEIKKDTGIENLLNLPSRRFFKVRVKFDVKKV